MRGVAFELSARVHRRESVTIEIMRAILVVIRRRKVERTDLEGNIGAAGRVRNIDGQVGLHIERRDRVGRVQAGDDRGIIIGDRIAHGCEIEKTLETQNIPSETIQRAFRNPAVFRRLNNKFVGFIAPGKEWRGQIELTDIPFKVLFED